MRLPSAIRLAALGSRCRGRHDARSHGGERTDRHAGHGHGQQHERSPGVGTGREHVQRRDDVEREGEEVQSPPDAVRELLAGQRAHLDREEEVEPGDAPRDGRRLPV